MKLWTWQKSGFDITNAESKVDSCQYSDHLRSGNRNFCLAYRKIWKQLGTDQILWCYCSEKEAKKALENPINQSNDLWEIDVPEDTQHTKICSVAWDYILFNRSCMPPESCNRVVPDKAINFNGKQFNVFWKAKNPDELWDLLFLKNSECVNSNCYHIIVFHPVDGKYCVRQTKTAPLAQA